jgi:hypothetical protein
MPTIEPLSSILATMLPPAQHEQPMPWEQRAADVDRVLNNDPRLNELRWQGSAATDMDVLALAQALAAATKRSPPNTHLRGISLHGNPEVSDRGVTSLLSALPGSIVCLDLAGTGTSAAVRLVARWLVKPRMASARPPSLPGVQPRRTVPERASTGSHGSQRRRDLKRVLLNDPKLQWLRWGAHYDCGVTHRDIKELAKVLPHNTHLQQIDLHNNVGVSDGALRVLGAALLRCGVVTVTVHGTSGAKAHDTWQGAQETVQLLTNWLTGHQLDKELEEEEEQKHRTVGLLRSGSVSSVTRTSVLASTVEERGPPDPMLLVLAAVEGSHDEVNQMLENGGAEVDDVDTEGRTALWHAAANGHAAVVSVLLDQGSSVDRRDYQGRAALLEAAARGHARVVSQLLEGSADCRAIDNSGLTPVIVATRLLAATEAEAKVGAVSVGRTEGHRPLSWAAVQIHRPCVRT